MSDDNKDNDQVFGMGDETDSTTATEDKKAVEEKVEEKKDSGGCEFC